MKTSKRTIAITKKEFNEAEEFLSDTISKMIAWLNILKPHPDFDPKVFESQNWHLRGDLDNSLWWVKKRMRDWKTDTLKMLEEKPLDGSTVKRICKGMRDELEQFILAYLKPKRLNGRNPMDEEYGEFVWTQWQVKGKDFNPGDIKQTPLF